MLQGLTQPKVSGYNNFSICTPLRYSYVAFGLCAEIVDAPSYRVLDLEWGLNSFNWQYARFGILFSKHKLGTSLCYSNAQFHINTWCQKRLKTSRGEAPERLKSSNMTQIATDCLLPDFGHFYPIMQNWNLLRYLYTQFQIENRCLFFDLMHHTNIMSRAD